MELGILLGGLDTSELGDVTELGADERHALVMLAQPTDYLDETADGLARAGARGFAQLR